MNQLEDFKEALSEIAAKHNDASKCIAGSLCAGCLADRVLEKWRGRGPEATPEEQVDRLCEQLKRFGAKFTPEQRATAIEALQNRRKTWPER